MSQAVPRRACRLRLALGLVLCTVLAAPAVAQDLDSLNEDLRVSVARLQYALDKLQGISFTLGVDDRRQRKALVREGKFLMERAARTGWGDETNLIDTTRQIDDLRVRVDRFLDDVAPVYERPQRTQLREWRSPFQQVLAFHDVAEDALRVPGLNDRERREIRMIIQQGEDIIREIRAVRESDHVVRGELVEDLIALRESLEGYVAASKIDRAPGYAFIPAHRVPQAWTSIGHTENGLTALRTRFLKPSTAYVTLRNDSPERRPVFIELEFYDAGGDLTGDGVFETAPLAELRPGEVREVLVPIFVEHSRFWNATESFAIYLD